MKKTIKVFIVDDHPLVRKGVTVCLSRHKDIKIIGETGDAREVVSMANDLRPDVVMMDIGMPHMNGVTVTAQLLRELPQTRVLILSIHENPEYLHQAMEAGAHGYILKGIPCADMISAVQTVNRGEFCFNSEMMEAAAARS